MRVIHPLKMDLVGPWGGNLLHMVQGDSNTRVVELQLFSNEEEWEPPVVEFVTVAFKKPDHTKGFYETDCDINGNRIQVVLAPQVLTAHGKVTVVVELHRSNGESLASFPFGIMVDQNPGVNAVASEDYFDYVHPLITEAVKEANLAAAEAYSAAEKANSASEVAYRAERKVDALREVVSKFHSNIVETARGEVIQLSDASDLELAGLRIFGKTTQNGIPTPEAPVPLESVGESVNVTIEGAGMPPQVLPVTITNDLGMPGIPVPSGGNYTDSNGRQWICDEIDFEKGVYVQRVYRQTYIGSSKETWKKALQVTKKDRFYTQYMVPNTTKPCLCNMAGWISEPSYDENGKCFVSFNDDDGICRFEIIASDYGTFGDAPEWRRYLGENPMEVLYVLDEEIKTPLSEIDPDALAQYATLHTNYPNTTISNDAGAGMEVKYVADTKLYIDKKFDELAAALVNNV